jgi:5'-phosphate synthase pdxT subunit
VAGNTDPAVKIGILALQGDVSLHATALAAIGIKPVFIKQPSQLKGVVAIIFPGGESSALLRLMEPLNMLAALRNFAEKGGSIFGTCAGAILLASKVTNPDQESLRLIDMTVERNGYGRQIDSGDFLVNVQLPGEPYTSPMTFIRAPRITHVGARARVLATRDNEPVLVMQNRMLGATFHPELSGDNRIYHYWIQQIVLKPDVKRATATGGKS